MEDFCVSLLFKSIEATPESGSLRERFTSAALNYILAGMRCNMPGGMATADALGGLSEQAGKWAVIYSPSDERHRRPVTIFQRNTAHPGEPFS